MADKSKSKSLPQRRNRVSARPAAADESVPAKSPPAALFTASIAVRWRDLDAFNHVNNSSFLTFLEEARLQWLKGISGLWFDAHSMPVLAAAELNYRAPITWPASITVELTCERLGNSSITLGHRIMAGDDARQLYCDGRTVLVWADPATGKSVDLPQAIRKACVS